MQGNGENTWAEEEGPDEVGDGRNLGFCDGPSSKRETLFCRKCRAIVCQQPYEGENEFHGAVCSGRFKVALRLLAKEGFHVNDEDARKR